MNKYRKTAVIVGILFIIGTVSGYIGAMVMGSVLESPLDLGKIAVQSGMANLGTLLILVMGLVLAFVPFLLYPIFKKHNEPLAIGYVVFRGALETVACTATVIIFLVLSSLGQEFAKAGADTSSLLQGHASLLLMSNDWITAMGAIVFALGALMYNTLWYKTKLIPRWLSVWGLIGAIIYLAEPLLLVFGVKYELLFAPLAVQEMVMAVWLIVKGFNSVATASEPPK